MSKFAFPKDKTVLGSGGLIQGEINGNLEELASILSFSIKAELNNIEIPTMGTRKMQHRPGGVKYSGSLEMYATKSPLVEEFFNSIKEGRDFDWNAYVDQVDDGNTLGIQSFLVTGILPTSLDIVKIDRAEDVQKLSMDFTADDVQLVNAFSGEYY